MILRRILGIALSGLFLMSPAHAATKIGVAVGIENIVKGKIAADIRDLAKDDPVNRSERIETKAAARATLLFDDFTTLSIGATSTIILDEFVYSPKGTQKITFNALKGAFRFVTGQARKEAYKVKTPTAVIGVRGTDFGIYINRLGTTLTLLRLGGVRVCLWLHDATGKRRPSQKCKEANQPDTYVIATKNKISGPFSWDGRNPFRILNPNSGPPEKDDGQDKGSNDTDTGGQQETGGGTTGGTIQ